MLPPATKRQPVHTRRIECQGYLRDDDLWDIEAHLIDTKSYTFQNQHRGDIAPGEPLHDMWIRMTIDDQRVIHDLVAVTDASPYAGCPDITPNFKVLIGEQIGPGWTAKVKRLLGGVQGCTHLVELLSPLATTAFQTLYSASKVRQTPPTDDATQRLASSQWIVDSCHMYSASGDYVREFLPEFYIDPKDIVN